jgi:hypothetical protein
MHTLLSAAWLLSGAVGKVALVLMLAGIFLITWGVVRYLTKHSADVGDAFPRAAWRCPRSALGFFLLFCGIGLDLLAVGVRLLIPGRI